MGLESFFQGMGDKISGAFGGGPGDMQPITGPQMGGALDTTNVDLMDGATLNPRTPDDTWFTQDRLKGMQTTADKLAQDNDKNAASNNALQSQMMQRMQLAEPKLAPAQLMPMAPMQLSTRVGRPSRTGYAAGGQMKGMSGQIKMTPKGMHMMIRSPSSRIKFADGGPIDQGAFAPDVASRVAGQLQNPAGAFADGGMMGPMMLNTMMGIRDKLNVTPPQNQGALQTGLQQGPGSGLSDSIHAKLADGGKVATGVGEYVMPADVTSFWGGHSSEAGGKAMDAFVDMTRKLDRHESKNRSPPR